MTGCQLFLGPCMSTCNHQPQNNKKRAAQLATTAFQSMSSEEQDEVYSDLYGFDSEESIEETTEFIEQKLKELAKELDKLDVKVAKYYLRAVEHEKKNKKKKKKEFGGEDKYVTSDKFLVMFLRADKYDCRLVARRLCAYFQEKFELFGDSKLACRIQQSDFNQEDYKALLSGAFCYIGQTDKVGRPIIFTRRGFVVEQSRNITSLKRVSFYTFQNALEDNEIAQTKGLVLIAYNMNDTFSTMPSRIRAILPLPRMMAHAIPTRCAAFHVVYDDAREHLFLNLVLVVLPKYFRARTVDHFYRTHDECIFSLANHGIDPSTLPLTEDGQFRPDMIREYFHSLRRLEQHQESTFLIA